VRSSNPVSASLPVVRHALVNLVGLAVLGALMLAPLLVTVWLASLLLQAAARLGGLFARAAGPWAPQGFLAHVLLTLAVLTLVGALARSPVGRRIGSAANRLVDQVPVAKSVYRGVQKMLASLGGGGQDTRKVVLIEFPSPDMKAVGLVTRRMQARDTGQELAAVYVPTTPNPSSGYIEIVPVERLVWLDWSAQEAIEFIMSGGVIGPERIDYQVGPPADELLPRAGPDQASQAR
jgi:uncharacterized membrane protein